MAKNLSIEQAAEMLGVSPKTIRRRIADGTLAANRIRGSRLIRIDADAVAALLRPIPAAQRGDAA